MNKNFDIFLVEDDEAVNTLITRILQRNGLSVANYRDVDSFLHAVFEEKLTADLLVLDYSLGGRPASELLDELQRNKLEIPFIIATGAGSEYIAVDMMRKGAREYLVKDQGFIEMLTPLIKKHLKQLRLDSELAEARQQLSLQHSILSAVHELSLDAILVLDPEGQILSANSRVESLLNLKTFPGDNGNIILQRLSSNLTERKLFLTAVANADATIEPMPIRHDNLQLNNGTILELFSAPMLTANKIYSGRVWYFRDITTRVRAQRDLEQAHQIAEQSAGDRARFLAHFSHEVRTPLNSLRGFLELLIQSPLDESQSEYVKLVNQSCSHLSELINDTLDLSKMEAGAFELHKDPLELVSLLQETSELFCNSQADNVHFELDLPEEVLLVMGDGLRLKQIITNLLSNAFKFTSEGSVCLSLHCKGGDFYHIAVRDTGVGIPTEVQPQIFNAYRQASSSTSRDFGGTGLGLSISAQLVRLMDSELKLESQVNLGSEFYFDVKLEPMQRN